MRKDLKNQMKELFPLNEIILKVRPTWSHAKEVFWESDGSFCLTSSTRKWDDETVFLERKGISGLMINFRRKFNSSSIILFAQSG